jgi:hypothetical protein
MPTALRAVLTAPMYLTGGYDELIASVRDEVFKHSDRSRDAKHQAFRRPFRWDSGRSGGVSRLIRQDIALSH